MKVLCSSCGTTLKVPKKSQDSYWQDIEPQSREAEVDYVGGVKEFLIQATPGVVVVVLMVWGAYYLASQVVGPSNNRPPLGTVTGTVTLNGEPLANAIVRFIPEAKKDENRAAPSQAITDDKGYYRLLYVRDVFGAAVGEHRVEISQRDANGREKLPAQYNRQTTLRQAVKSGSQVIDLKLEMVIPDENSVGR